MRPTRNDIPASTRTKVAKILNQRLADAIDLQSQAKAAHWNVRGSNFAGVHALFDTLYEEVGEYIDLIAERVVQLGGTAEGTVRIAAKRSSLDEYPSDIVASADHIIAIASALATFAKSVRAAIDETDDLDDKDSADILTEVSRGTDKILWMVEAHQDPRAK